MDDHFIITYKITLKSPMKSFGIKDVSSNKMIIPASSMRGATRWTHNFSSNFIDNEKIQTKIFGNETQLAQVYFSNLVAIDDVELMNIASTRLDNKDINSLYISEYIPMGTEFIGELIVRNKLTGIERAFALSMVLDMSRIGVGASQGHGQCDVEILNRNRTTVFISYAWGDKDYMKWVYNLAVVLSEKGIDVILDQLSEAFDVSAPQNEINHWMTQAINNSDKIIAILTPEYCDKSKKGHGGVGYEHKHLINEKGLVTDKVKRYVGLLYSGDENCRPPYLEDIPMVDMSRGIENTELDALVQLIKT